MFSSTFIVWLDAIRLSTPHLRQLRIGLDFFSAGYRSYPPAGMNAICRTVSSLGYLESFQLVDSQAGITMGPIKCLSQRAA